AAAVRPQQAQHFTRVQDQRQRFADNTPGIADIHVHGLNHWSALLRRCDHSCRPDLISRNRKKGAPTMAVSTPSGNSMVLMLRASVSTNSMNAPPNSNDAGSSRANTGPTSNRAMCGITRPTQPITPANDTTLAVISV